MWKSSLRDLSFTRKPRNENLKHTSIHYQTSKKQRSNHETHDDQKKRNTKQKPKTRRQKIEKDQT